MFCQSLIHSLGISTSSCSCVKTFLKSVALWSKCDCDRLLEPLCFSCKKIERFITLEVVWVAQLVARHRRCQSKPNLDTSWSTWPCPGQLLIGFIDLVNLCHRKLSQIEFVPVGNWARGKLSQRELEPEGSWARGNWSQREVEPVGTGARGKLSQMELEPEEVEPTGKLSQREVEPTGKLSQHDGKAMEIYFFSIGT